MNDNIVTLVVLLVAVNLILITVAVIRAMLRKDRNRSDAYYDGAVMRRPLAAGVSSPISPPLGSELTSSRTDSLTGLLVVKEWNRIVADEDARVNRYRHPATVVIIELDGFDRLVANLGPDAGDRVLPALADTLSRNARGADHLARIGSTRFGILLPETDEVVAINYIERVREACDLWLESGAIALHLSIGWASPGPDSSLAVAVARAQERMFAEQRRALRLANDIDLSGPPPVHDIGGSPSLA
jgi:diguanylate cyclase (GGDEF)-like protein